MKKTITSFEIATTRDTLEDYFEWSRRHTPALQKTLTAILRRPIKRQMLDQSEPYRALCTGDAALIERFFGSETPVSSTTPTALK